MDEHIESYLDRCRCCLEEITLAKVEIDNNIEIKFFEMTQLNLPASNLLASYICYDCYEILTNYSSYRSRYIENHQRLEQLLLNAENSIAEEENDVIEYEEIELREDDDEQIIVEEEVDEEIVQETSDDEDEEELRLEDIVKPEFLHYCLPKKDPEPIKKVFHVPRQLEKRKRKLNQEVLKEQVNQETEFMCQECEKICPNLDFLEQHINRYHPKFICEYQECAKVCSSQIQLDKHTATFHKTILYECTQCDKKFYEKLHLKNHMYVHNQ
ncbi:unnamed protein product [Chironomus riparius]|uniref:C2H2-type domain-containing protein n=1 Tax=Chironomus riparius TaxID=315576 RepID=A0A9N9WR59_9DIPT|nr:unnamed protein product [Chironomus riparius]